MARVHKRQLVSSSIRLNIPVLIPSEPCLGRPGSGRVWGLFLHSWAAQNPWKRVGKSCSPSQPCLTMERLKDICSGLPLWNTNSEQKMPEGDEGGALCWKYFPSPQQFLGCFSPALGPCSPLGSSSLECWGGAALERDFLFISAGIKEVSCHQHSCCFHPALKSQQFW